MPSRFLIFLIFIFASCSQKEELVESTHADGSPKTIGIYQKKNNEKRKSGEIKFYEDGKKEMEGFYNENLQREGKWMYWFNDGKVWSKCEYKNGIKHGKSTVYFENGQKRYEGKYENDSTVGIWKFWNEKGELVKQIQY